MNLLIIDLETTGVDSEDNGIVSICAKLFNKDRKEVTSFKENLRPSDVVTDLGALKVNRYKMRDIESFKSEKEVIHNLCDWLLGIKVEGEIVLGGHNVPFDLEFLKNKLKKHNIVGLESVISYRTIDTAPIGRFLVLSGVLPNVKASLKDLALALNIEYNPNEAHSAEYDVDLTAKILFAMIDLLKGRVNG